jgi:hypothetical protein
LIAAELPEMIVGGSQAAPDFGLVLTSRENCKVVVKSGFASRRAAILAHFADKIPMIRRASYFLEGIQQDTWSHQTL